MTTWNTIYLIGGILAGGLGVWNLARRRNPYLSITGILWFLVILFKFFVANVGRLVLISGLPTLGQLLQYVAVPVFLVLAFFYVGPRR